MSNRHTGTATVVTVLVVLTLLVSGAVALIMGRTSDPIDQYLDEVRDLASEQYGERPPDDDGRFNTAALLGAAFTCGLRDEPLFADAVTEAVETNELAGIASRYCDTAFSDPLTDEERAKYGVQLLGAPAQTNGFNIPAPPAQDAVDAVTDAQDSVAKLNEAPPFTGYTCEPNADAKMDDPRNPNVITNKACPDIQSEKEAAHREYAERSIGDNDVPPGYCDPYTRMQLDGTPC